MSIGNRMRRAYVKVAGKFSNAPKLVRKGFVVPNAKLRGSVSIQGVGATTPHIGTTSASPSVQ